MGGEGQPLWWVVVQVVMMAAAATAATTARRHLAPSSPYTRFSRGITAVARTLLQEELEGCFLTLIGGGPEVTQLLAQLAVDLRIAYQVASGDLDRGRSPNITWEQSPCDAFLVLDGRASGLLEYLQEDDSLPWNYRGKYVFFGASCWRDLKPLANTRKMIKTEHALFVCGGRGAGLEVWTHWLYSLVSWRLIGHASPQALTRLSPFFPAKLADLQGFSLVVKTFAFAPAVFGTLAKEEPREGVGKPREEGREEEEKQGNSHEGDEGKGDGGGGKGRVFLPEGGQDVSVILLLAKYLNFTVQWRHPGPELWGDLQKDGSYTGVIGQVGSGNGDLGVANIFLDYLRTRYATFTWPYTYETACFITPAPQELPPWISLGSPFSPEVWAALVVTFLGASLVSPFLARLLEWPRDSAMFYSWGRWFLYTVGLCTCQSQDVPLTNRLRIASLSLQLMGFVAAISFSGNLTAFLMTPKVEAAIRSLRQLDDSGLEVVGFSNFWLDSFLASQNTHLLSLARKYHAVADTLPVFREVAERRSTVLIENRNHLEFIQSQFYTTRSGKTPLRIQEECVATFGVSAALNKDSPLEPYINKAIHYMQAAGLDDQFFKEVLVQHTHGSVLHHDAEQDTWLALHDRDLEATGARALSLKHLLGAFLVLGTGYLLASATLCVEKSYLSL